MYLTFLLENTSGIIKKKKKDLLPKETSWKSTEK